MNDVNKMKVAIITMSFPYDRETFAINEFVYLKDYCDLEVHSLRPKHKIADQLMQDYDMQDLKISHYSWRSLLRFAVYSVRYFSVLWYLLRGIFSINFGKRSHLLKSLIFVPRIMEMFAHLKRNPPDIVHAYWCHFPALLGFLCERYLKNTKFTINYIAHDIYIGYNIAAYTKDVFGQHISICEENIPYIQSLGVKSENIHVIYHGVPRKYLDYPLRSKQAFSILSVGSMIQRKSFDLVMEAYKKLKENYPQAQLTIGGDGPQHEYLSRRRVELGLENDVQFTGYLMHDEVMRLMNEAEIFLLMSKNERIANVTKEAMLMKCYCVATKTPGVEELITDGSNGFLIEIDDVDGAVNAIQTIWENRITHEKVLSAARDTIEDKFILEKNIHKYIEIWTSMPSN